MKLLNKLLFKGLDISSIGKWEVTSSMDWLEDILKTRRVPFLVEKEIRDGRAETILFWCKGKLYRAETDIIFIDGGSLTPYDEKLDDQTWSTIHLLLNMFNFKKVFAKQKLGFVSSSLIQREDIEVKRPIFKKQPVVVLSGLRAWALKKVLLLQAFRVGVNPAKQFTYLGWTRPFEVESAKQEESAEQVRRAN